jgi:hypothetical protein
MASQYYWTTSWVATEGGEMAPGDTHWWTAWFFSYGDVITFTAHSVIGDPEAVHRILAVENVQMEGRSDGGRIVHFSVRNAGNSYIPGYLVGSSVVNQ